MNILIVEDEELAVRKLKSVVAEVDPSNEVVDDCDSIESTVNWLNNHATPDLILMDIELADGQSFEIFEKAEVKCPVIFTTSYDEFAIQAFRVNSVAYLLKPVEKEDLESALNKYQQLKEFYSTKAPGFSINNLVEQLQSRLQPKGYRKRFLVKFGTKLISVETQDIAYFYTEGRINFFRTHDNKKYVVDYTIDELQHMIDPDDFFRINRGCFISIKSVEKIDEYFGQRLALQLLPKADEQVIVSREKVTAFKTWMGK